METIASGKLGKIINKHAPEVSRQTGFPSAATHYTETPIDLHAILVTNKDATFFIRIASDEYMDLNILDHDVILVDRSLPTRHNMLALVVVDGAFKILRIPHEPIETDYIVWGMITYIIHKAQ